MTGPRLANRLRWYDSTWLSLYLAAKATISRVAPGRLAAFMEGLRPLRTDPTFTVKELRGLLDADTLATVRQTIRSIPLSTMGMHEIERFGRLIVHDHPTFSALQRELTGRVSELVGEEVEPSYNFLSLYMRMGVCEPHLDAPSAKWTLDLCVDQSEPWPIHFSQIVPWPEEHPDLGDDWQAAIKRSPALTFEAKVLAPNDAVVFSGSSQFHYRDALPRKSDHSHCDLLFFHYIPRGTSEVANPCNWARIFDIPELASIPGITERC